MKIRNLSILLVFVLAISSCNLPSNKPAQNDENEAPPPAPTLENTPLPPEPTATLIPSETPLPTDTPLPTATFTPTVPVAWPKDLNVNCRFGYGTEWLAVGALVEGQPAEIKGKNPTASWWYVALPNTPSTPCWVAASVTNTSGNLAALPVINQSIASVTGVSIEKPDTISVAGCLGPIQPLDLKGSIEMNGPGTASWHFDTQQSGVITDHATDFDTVGSKSVSDSFVPPLTAGSYWLKLVVIGPNDKQAESSYKIECP